MTCQATSDFLSSGSQRDILENFGVSALKFNTTLEVAALRTQRPFIIVSIYRNDECFSFNSGITEWSGLN